VCGVVSCRFSVVYRGGSLEPDVGPLAHSAGEAGGQQTLTLSQLEAVLEKRFLKNVCAHVKDMFN